MTFATFRPQASVVSPLNDLVNEFLGRDIGHTLGHDDLKLTPPRVNIVERPTAFELHLLVPGYTKEDLKLRMENEVLTISAEMKSGQLQENERYTRREFNLGAFSRSFRLPPTVSADSVKAEFSNGVLHVVIPKREVNKPAAREIPIG